MENSTIDQPVTLYDAFYSVLQLNDWVMSLKDPKVDDFPMAAEIYPTVCVCSIYIALVQYIIPSIMQNREPLQLKPLLVFYNFGMVFFNMYLHYEFWMAGWGTGYNFLCENMDYDINPKTIRMANLIWWYYITKFIDMFDTVFIALRKQNHKITFLHYFHHLTMPLNIWVILRFLPGGHCTFHGLTNSLVHICMYFYYGVAALGPKYRKFLWWKKYVTMIQLIQFYLDCIHLGLPFIYECDFPKVVLLYMLSQTSVFLVLFTDFYIRTYVSIGKRRPYKMSIANGDIDKSK